MVERVVGQLSLADSLVSVPGESMLSELDAALNWAPVQALLGRRGGVGAGNSSYPAEPLLRCLLLGVWHGLSDPALERAIADRISFRRFAGFSLHDRTPDHSTLWRFREALAQDGLMDEIFAEITRQLSTCVPRCRGAGAVTVTVLFSATTASGSIDAPSGPMRRITSGETGSLNVKLSTAGATGTTAPSAGDAFTSEA